VVKTQTKIDHPYVEIIPKICRGSPTVAGTHIRIADIAVEYEYMNYTPDDIVNSHPHLKLEQVHAALSYHYEHRAEINNKIKENKKFVEKLRQNQRQIT
jgi:uncharacterized protein (DUF433 family)